MLTHPDLNLPLDKQRIQGLTYTLANLKLTRYLDEKEHPKPWKATHILTWKVQNQKWKSIELRSKSSDPTQGAYIKTQYGIGVIEGYLFHFIALHLTSLIYPQILPFDLQAIHQIDVLNSSLSIPSDPPLDTHQVQTWKRQAQNWTHVQSQTTLSASQAQAWFELLAKPSLGLASLKDLYTVLKNPLFKTPLSTVRLSLYSASLPSNLSQACLSSSSSNQRQTCSLSLTFYPSPLSSIVYMKPSWNDALFHLPTPLYSSLINPLSLSSPRSPSTSTPSPLLTPLLPPTKSVQPSP